MDANLTSTMVDILAPAAGLLVTALVSWVTAEVARYVRRKTKNEVAINAVDRFCHTVTTTVAELAQTMVPAMRARMKDGNLSEEDWEELRRIARQRVKDRLVPGLQKDAQLTIADLDDFLSAKIEQAFREQHRSRGFEIELGRFSRRKEIS